MKSTRNIPGGLSLITSLVVGLHFLHAQTAVVGGFNGDAAPVQLAQPDSIVQIAAEAQGLELVPPDQVPPFGTFWMVLPEADGGVMPPFPCAPLDLSLPVFAIADGQFLVDGTVGSQATLNTAQAGRLAAGGASAAALAAQADAVINLITEVQTAAASQQMRALAQTMDSGVPSPPGEGEEGGEGNYTNNYFGYAFDTNRLYLEITNVSGGWSYLNLHNATNQVYAIWGATNVATPFTNWTVETEVWPTPDQTNVMPFTVPTLDRQILFLRAEDWTGVTENGNAVPDWWFWFYYGTTALSDTNLDCCWGNTLLCDYTNGISPTGLAAGSSYVQTCCSTPAAVALSGYDYCGEDPATFRYVVVAGPTNGYLTGAAPDLTYWPSNANFTGTDGFTYKVSHAWGGESATGAVSITVGDQYLYPNNQSPMTGTNQPVNITLTAYSPLGCTNSFTYTVVDNPIHGTNSGTGANRTYTPNHNYEGADGFTFNVSDGVFTSSYPATVTIFVVAGPTNLTAQCRFDQIVLNWSLDDAVQQMEPMGLNILDFQVYRSTNHGGPYTLIYTTAPFANTTNYVDMAVATNTTYYYVVTFQYQDPNTGTNYESPYAKEASASPCSLPAPLRPGFNQNILAPNDDNQGVDNLFATLPFAINFYGSSYSNLYVNNNGLVTFAGDVGDYQPGVLSNSAALFGDIIAPFWADVDTRNSLSGLVSYGTNIVNGRTAFGANWINVGYFSEQVDKLDSFQLVMIDRSDISSGDFDMEFNYAQIQWEAGSASGGVNGFWVGPTPGPPRAGWASASNSTNTFEINGSGDAGALLDTNLTTGLIHSNFNSSLPGRYVFQLRNGVPVGHP